MTHRALAQLMRDVAERGFAVVEGLFTHETLVGLSERLAQLQEEERLRPARVGRGDEQMRKKEVRGDLISWLPEPPADLMGLSTFTPQASPLTPTIAPLPQAQQRALTHAELSYYKRINELITQLNRAFFVGVKGFEFHYARYEAGAGYERHSDRFKGSSERVFSLVTYLNPAWQPSHGGALKLYLPPEREGDEERALEVAPQWGYTVCFESARFEHEVLPAYAPRESVTGWLRA